MPFKAEVHLSKAEEEDNLSPDSKRQELKIQIHMLLDKLRPQIGSSTLELVERSQLTKSLFIFFSGADYNELES
jgi:hypothetical protein